MSQERPIRLHAGPWCVEIERWNGWIRNVRLGDFCVLRSVYAAVRGENWETYRFHLVNNHIAQESDGFQATWTMECEDISFRWQGSCRSDGRTLDVAFEGQGDETIRTRRTGMCVLHPHELKGSRCQVVHPDGTVAENQFPELVAAQQPFHEVRELRMAADQAQGRLEFLGDVFETEDQRNWTDASFKTYSRPKEWPSPYELSAGEIVLHKLRLTFEGEVAESVCRPTTHLALLETAYSVPFIGVRSANPEPEGFDFALVEDEETKVWSTTGLKPDISFTFDRGTLEFLEGPFFYGIGRNLIDVNSRPPDMRHYDGIAFGVNPQVHATDDRTIMENVHPQADAVRTALELSDGKPVFVGPVTFGKDGEDPRLGEPIAKAWIAASFATLTEANANAICFDDAELSSRTLREVVDLMQEFRSQELVPMRTTHPYRAIGFRLRSATAIRDCFVNMTPFSEEISFEGGKFTLDPYELRVVDMSDRSLPSAETA